MAKPRKSKSPPAHGPKPARETRPAPGGAANQRLTAQNRKLLGKHYANKYRVGR